MYNVKFSSKKKYSNKILKIIFGKNVNTLNVYRFLCIFERE